MDGEVFFRRSVFGGFNREDVMRYISKVTFEKDDADKTAEQLKKAEEEIAALKQKAEDDAATIADLEQKLAAAQTDLQAASTRMEEQQSKTGGYDSTADRLMRDSMAYADRYVESAELMARNIREELSQKVTAADAQVTDMLSNLDALSSQSSALGIALRTLKDDLGEISKSFEKKDV